MIKLESVTVRFDGATPLCGFSAELPESGTAAVFGPSGKGKSTFMKLLAGLIEPDSGSVSGLDGKRIAVVFQEDRLLPWMSAYENVLLTCGDAEKARKALEAVELDDSADKPARELSGGMKRRTAIARAMAFGGDVLLLDEPFTGLDDSLKARIIERIKNAFPLTVIATHDRNEAAALEAETEIKI